MLEAPASSKEPIIFQVGLWSPKLDLAPITYRLLKAPTGVGLRCLTLEGFDHKGQAWHHPSFHLRRHSARTLWFAVELGERSPTQERLKSLRLVLDVGTNHTRTQITVHINVVRDHPSTGGSAFMRPDTLARLVWLDSRRGHDDPA